MGTKGKWVIKENATADIRKETYQGRNVTKRRN
jgi:hypothetical protein